ncbi:MAG: putative ATP-binding protein involved in virulence [Phenylobacterium sp.]|jgi:predicted ATP-binding protein involved in virulence
MSANELSGSDFGRILSALRQQPLVLDEIILTNFRRIEDLTLALSHQYNQQDNLTVFIGDNGAGKTTILNAIALSLSWLIANITKQGKNGSMIKTADINNKKTAEFASVSTCLRLKGIPPCELNLSKSKDGSPTAKKNTLSEIRLLGDIYRTANAQDNRFNLPLMAFYPVERSIETKPQDLNKAKEFVSNTQWSKFDGYKDALQSHSNFALFVSWFRHFDDINNAQNKDDNALLNEIEKTNAELALLQQLDPQNQLQDNSIQNLFLAKQEHLETLEKQYNNVQQPPSRILKTVINAIANFMPDLTHLRIQRLPNFDLLVDKEGEALSVLQLSQGEKTLIALVGDIARRMVMLNPSLDNPLTGFGVVLIDEIDLHLHPDWQQKVVGNLQKTFPNIQFILTTHSPQVLTTVPAQSIRIIKHDKGKMSVEIPEFSLGAESYVMLQELQGVSSRPQNIKIVQGLTQYQALVRQDLWDSSDALALRTKLDRWAGEHDPVLMKTDMDIRLRKRRKKLDLEG